LCRPPARIEEDLLAPRPGQPHAIAFDRPSAAGNLPHYAAALERFRPVYLSGYPSSMYVLAEYYRQSGRPAPRLKAALTSAETLLDHQRVAIEETFATRVFDQYGQAEMQSFWYECEAGRMHAHPLAGVTEILRPDGAPAAPGEMGEVVLTGLVNYAMPLIRYRVGDTARFATEAVPAAAACRSSRRSAAGLTILSIPANAVFSGAWIRY
jgi:phenylacetate-coenzyme A ligase PaaK-like adenylate-forming protein